MSQPPGHGAPPPGYPPQRPGRTPPLLVGAVLGGVDVVTTTLLGLTVASSGNRSWLVLLMPAIGLLIPVVLLFGASTRWWGVGMLIGYFLTLIVLGGACVALLYGLSSAVGG